MEVSESPSGSRPTAEAQVAPEAQVTPEARTAEAAPTPAAAPAPPPDGRVCTAGQSDVTRGGRWHRIMRAWPGLSDPWMSAVYVVARRWLHS